MVDPIADFLTRIRNAQLASHSELSLPYSKTKHNIAKVMKKNKFLTSVEKKKDADGKFDILVVGLPEKKLTLKRVSRCGQRMYTSADKIRKVTSGYGIAVISTSKGMMTGYEARSLNIGGEYVCEVS